MQFQHTVIMVTLSPMPCSPLNCVLHARFTQREGIAGERIYFGRSPFDLTGQPSDHTEEKTADRKVDYRAAEDRLDHEADKKRDPHRGNHCPDKKGQPGRYYVEKTSQVENMEDHEEKQGENANVISYIEP